jgi:hypothetical protein
MVVLLVLVGCGCRQGQATRDGKLLSLERSACYGPCPVYSITVYSDGRIVYRGVSFVKLVGEATGHAEVATIDTLRREIRRARLWSLRERCCDCYDMTDQPGVKISYDFGFGQRGRVDHYHGCSAAPTWLGNLEDRIDEILDTDRFIGNSVERYQLFHPTR